MPVVETVTVLFTDLVGSTSLSSTVGPAAAEELRREHFALLREAISGAGGAEVKNLGDGLMVTFASASSAVTCGVAMQQGIERRNRGAEEQLSIRVGIAHGEADREEDDWFGPPVVEASRLCARAQGGQILVGELARMMAAGREGRAFAPVGSLELKGLPEPVEAFEVAWEPSGAAPGDVPLPARLRGVPPLGYVGRETERERIAALWEAARGGLRQAVLISGEPGIGKTRLASHAALEFHGEGATVLYGHCEEELSAPYGVWIQALSHYVDHAPEELLAAYVERHGGELGRLLPALRRRREDLPEPTDSDPETERYLLFSAVAGLLEAASGGRPMVLLLDDLHLADKPSLALLRHVVAESSTLPLLLLGTYRESDLAHDHPLTDTLADLRREEGVERLPLAGLGEDDVVAIMEAAAGHALEATGLALAREIAAQTDGNAFFVGEMLRHLSESGALAQGEDGRWELKRELGELGLPQSVREVIGRRIERLGDISRGLLRCAAVIGRDFQVELLQRVIREDEDELLDELEAAVEASVLVERSEPGRFSFAHALINQTLYEEVGATRRARLHRRVAEALEEMCGADPGPRVAELARHWSVATAPVDAGKAISYSRQAGERALAELAPDEAVRWFAQALDLLEKVEAPAAAERCELLIGLGDAQRQAGDPGYRDTLVHAAQLAERVGDADRQARAVLATWRGTPLSLGQRDDELVAALEAAPAALPENDPRRAELLADLAAELTFSAPLERRRELADEALALARRAGDPRLLCNVLERHTFATWVAHTIDERIPHLHEAVALADEVGDPALRLLTAARGVNVLEAGDLSGFDACVARAEEILAAVPQPIARWTLLLTKSPRALMAGRLDEAESLAMEALEASGGSADGTTIFGAQIHHIRWEQGRVHELVDLVAQAVIDNPTLPAFRCAHALSLCSAGSHEKARELLDAAAADGFASIPLDVTWSVTLANWSDVALQVGAREAAGALYELLLPHQHTLIWNGANAHGPATRHLGRLALMLERYDDAEAHLAAATAEHERLGAPIWQADTDRLLGLTLLRCPGGDDQRGRELLRRAAETARRHGAERIAAEAESALGELTVT